MIQLINYSHIFSEFMARMRTFQGVHLFLLSSYQNISLNNPCSLLNMMFTSVCFNLHCTGCFRIMINKWEGLIVVSKYRETNISRCLDTTIKPETQVFFRLLLKLPILIITLLHNFGHNYQLPFICCLLVSFGNSKCMLYLW